MADVGIKGPAQKSAPLTYTLADAAEFIPRTIKALFDGSSATSAFYPCLVLTSAGGLEVARIKTDESVPAGGQREVTWFPGVKPATVPGATAYLWGVYSSQAIPTGTTGAAVQWNHFQTNDTGVFGTDTSALASPPYNDKAGDSYLYFSATGSYVAAGEAVLPNGTYDQAVVVDNIGPQWTIDRADASYQLDEQLSDNTGLFSVTAGLTGASHYLFFVDSTTGTGIVRLLVTQTSGSPQGLVNVAMGLVYGDGGTADLASVY